MIFNAKSEPAVSPVIGTILLVAIAVILVAIILVVVMGFSGDTNEKKVGLNAKSESGANATLILYGGASIDELVMLEMIDQGSLNGSYVKLWDINENGTAFVGLPYLAEGVAQPLESMAVYDTRINVRGTFTDGSEVILLVQPMTFYNVEKFGDNDETDNNDLILEAPEFDSIKTNSVRAFVYYDISKFGASPGMVIHYSSTNGAVSGTIDNPTQYNDGKYTGKHVYRAVLDELPQDTEYNVWGEIPSQSIEGTKGTVATLGTIVTDPEFVSSTGSQLTVKIYYENAETGYPTATINYRSADGNYEGSLSGTALNRLSDENGLGYRAIFTDLPQGTDFYIQAEVATRDRPITTEEVGPFSTLKTTVTKPELMLRTSSQLNVKIYYANAEAGAYPSTTIYYRSTDGNYEGSLSVAELSRLNDENGRGYRAIFTNLPSGTEFEVWATVHGKNPVTSERNWFYTL